MTVQCNRLHNDVTWKQCLCLDGNAELDFAEREFLEPPAYARALIEEYETVTDIAQEMYDNDEYLCQWAHNNYY